MVRLCCVLSLVGAVAALRNGPSKTLKAKPDVKSYSFDRFVKDFGKSYKADSSEYQHRLSLFQASVVRIEAMNAKNVRENRGWKAGIHEFMDWTPAERKVMMGYKPSHARPSAPAARMTVLQRSTQKAKAQSNLSFAKDFSWETTPSIRQQGSCGSCWAISAVEAVEAQLQQQHLVSQICLEI